MQLHNQGRQVRQTYPFDQRSRMNNRTSRKPWYHPDRPYVWLIAIVAICLLLLVAGMIGEARH